MERFNQPIIVSLCLFLLTVLGGNAWAITATAQKIYESHSSSVFQIKIIDISSGEQSVIGSGFRFSKEGLFATNYHVVSDVLDTPDRYRIEYHQKDDKKGELSIVALDVAHDLAILKGEKSAASFLSLGSSSRLKGDRVFPMGNPYDLGMNIIEGTFNGRVGVEPYQQILLSAPINPGMSGGPALDSSGKVIGINVAVGGNNLSFLVPAEYLIQLAETGIEKQQTGNWQEIIQNQILEKQDHMIGKILEVNLPPEKFGSLKVPENLLTTGMKCWGNSKAEDLEKEQYYSFGHKQCKSEGDIFLSSSLFTGKLGYSFVWLESDFLGPLEFYEIYSTKFAASKFIPYASEEDVSEFGCVDNFVKLAGHDWKAAYCVRYYKNFPKLHDVYVSLAALGNPKRGHLIRIGLAGIDEKRAGLFLQKLLGGVQWAD